MKKILIGLCLFTLILYIKIGTATTWAETDSLNFNIGRDGSSPALDPDFFTTGEIITPVTEAGATMLLGAGLFGLAIYGKRRRNVVAEEIPTPEDKIQ